MAGAGMLWALGLVGVVFGLLNLLIGLFGAGFDLFWIGGNLGLGGALLVAAVFSNVDALRERVTSGEAKRAGKYGSSALAGTALGIAILAGLAFLSTRYSQRFDWSEAQVHSLSDQTLKLLEGLEQDVVVTAFVPPVSAQPVRDVLDRYAHASESFRYEVVDPNERPELLAQKEVPPAQLGESGVLHVQIGEESTLVSDVDEQNLTNAIVKITRTATKKVYFVESHGERAIEGEAGQALDGFGRAADALRNENYTVEKLLLARFDAVPADADALVLAAPTRPLMEAEESMLTRYLQGGGSLLVLADTTAPPSLARWLDGFGVQVGSDVIVDRQLAMFGRATTPFAERYDVDHEITRELRETTLFQMVRSVAAKPGSGGLHEIVLTGDNSWAETDLERFFGESTAELDPGSDRAGPVPIAVAGELPVATPPAEGADGEEGASADHGRLVVFGDADFAANELIDSARNRDLFVNSANWLIGDVEAISIRPRVSAASRFEPTAEEFMRVRSLTLFVLPEAIAVLGVLVWWSRRRAAVS